ncbi:hypothetical protein JXM67_06385 [candidate division WOR-3 bacterium]|nr:hypothetical protein [candidate division WOR-3 bacterium]
MNWPLLIKVLGIVTWSLVFLTVLGGLLRKKLAPVLKKSYLKIHMTVGIVALALATAHGLIVLVVY